MVPNGKNGTFSARQFAKRGRLLFLAFSTVVPSLAGLTQRARRLTLEVARLRVLNSLAIAQVKRLPAGLEADIHVGQSPGVVLPVRQSPNATRAKGSLVSGRRLPGAQSLGGLIP